MQVDALGYLSLCTPLGMKLVTALSRQNRSAKLNPPNSAALPADASAQASRVAASTGSVAAGIHAAAAAATEGHAAPPPPPAAHKPPRRWAIPGLGWRRRRRREADAEAAAAAATSEAEAQAMAAERQREREREEKAAPLPWWRPDRLARRAKRGLTCEAAMAATYARA